ncbi:ABC transporter ATP-binding protein [Roseomonas haemaphysalidis]|uniref:ABC transporter ATP-binding protein n=1 Tax=Roseomonas haemaphysalidis TaxID=2768162 RepID=A0ABS3KP18_9PROT|nr:ATP-binding cassette domain-containing protein [Roseomonas haemaphysalidis]MBO1079210.1 ABC transporter ATP-binding protein [Roseomonas haemaphysalidis]
MSTGPLLRVEGLCKHYGGGGGLWGRTPPVRAVDGVSFHVQPRETLGLVGESGSGKSTTGRLVLQLEPATAGEVWFEGRNLSDLSTAALRAVRARMQVVFQDPYAALDPRMTVGDFVAEPLVIHRAVSSRSEREDRVAALFRRVGLNPDFMRRYPHEFSGGQRQRVGIARAIALGPSFIVADEPITALDVSIQAQVVNLFQDMQQEMGIAFLFIAHDLNMVRYLCQRVAVMLRGRIVEMGPVEAIFGNPLHAYTRALLSAVPVPDPDVERGRQRIRLSAADLTPPPGAALVEAAPGHFVLR